MILSRNRIAAPLGRSASKKTRSPQAALPYLTTEQNFNVRLLQSTTGAKHGVFFTHPLETVSVHSERNPDDPRVTHELVVEVDEFGNLKRKANIAYSRAGSPEDLQVEQQRFWATLTEASFVNQANDPTFYRVGVGFETKSYELTGLTLPAGGQGLLSLADLTTFLGVSEFLCRLTSGGQTTFEKISS